MRDPWILQSDLPVDPGLDSQLSSPWRFPARSPARSQVRSFVPSVPSLSGRMEEYHSFHQTEITAKPCCDSSQTCSKLTYR